eukprot:m.79047 g.79047  ORF g.79047 m.79047 type:complete len:491 (-) comp8591_c0_seq1:3347-4819(-)
MVTSNSGGGKEYLVACAIPAKEHVVPQLVNKEDGNGDDDNSNHVSYWALGVFVFSLAANSVVFDVAVQFVNAGISKGKDVQETLAAFGLATFIIQWVCAVYAPFEPMGLVITDSRQSRRVIMTLLFQLGGMIGLVIVLLAISPLGDVLINKIHHADEKLSADTKECLLLLVLWPVFDGLHRFHRGVLLKHGKHIRLVWLASMANVFGQATSVLILVHFPLSKPVFLPITTVYTGIILETMTLLWGYKTYVRSRLPKIGDEPLTNKAIIKFAWPLTIVQIAQRSSRPLVNILVNRTDSTGDGFGVAVLSLVYPLAHLGYGWLNNMKPLIPTFSSSIERTIRDQSPMKVITRFFLICGLFSFGVQVIILWTPLKLYILKSILGAPHDLADAAAMPLFLYSFISIAVAFRCYCTSWATAIKKTKLLASSSVVRFGGVVLGGMVLPCFGLHGATMGVSCLVIGFGFEACAVVYTTHREKVTQLRCLEEEGKAKA